MDKAPLQNIELLGGFEALATPWFVEVFESIDEKCKGIITSELKAMILDFEKKYSRFNQNSLLTTLNNKRSVPYDFHMVMMLTQAKKMTEVSHGFF